MKPLKVVIIKLLVLQHPIPKLLVLQFACSDVDAVASENANRESFHQVMNIGGYHLYIVIAHLDL